MTPRPDPAARPARILIVDDDAMSREVVTAMLAHEGFTLVHAAGGAEALAQIADEPPDLVLLDLMMPGMDGHEIARRIKADPATMNIPVIIITAQGDSSMRMLGLHAGAEDYLTKPVNRAELCLRVRNLLRLKAHGDYHDRNSQLLEREVEARTAKLAASELLYRSTFDEAPVGIAHVDVDGRWLHVNQHLCELLGYRREQLLTDEVQARIHAQATPGEADALRQLAAGNLERLVIDDVRYVCRNGRIVWARVIMSVHRDAMGVQHFITVIEDITERRTLEAQVRQASKMDAIGRLASGVSHDFNNLLSVILSYAQMLSDDLKQGDPMRDDLDEIRSAGVRAVALTQQLLAFSRQQVLQPKVVDLAEVVDGMENMLRRLIGEDVELIVLGAPALGRILVDPGQMEQVIMNLAVNARDAMLLCGKLTIATSAVMLDDDYTEAHPGSTPGPHVMLAVSDTGSGMDKATQARMFEPFFTTKEVGTGTGLGLATVFGIVQQSGGTLDVESELGQGTTIRVYFPTTTTEAATVVLPRPHRRTLRGVETILLVEDEEQVRVLARTILRKYGYNVLEAQTAGDAIVLCEQHPSEIHLLLTDVVMPRMSGRQLCERLHAIRPTMKVLYMSGYTDDAVVRHGVLDSTIAFIQKPITPEPLAAKVREALAADSPVN